MLMRTLVLALHVAWLLWMIGGVVLAALGYRYARLWAMSVFRTMHLLGIVATATVPLWNDGICPLTRLEGDAVGGHVEPLLTRILEAIVYWDVSPIYLSLLTAAAGFVTVFIYFRHPPWRSAITSRAKSRSRNQIELPRD